MGFLSKLLKAIAFLPAIITGVEPLFGSGNGTQKKDAAVSLIGTIVGVSESIASKDIIDNGMFQEGLKQAIDGVVKMLNASIWYKH
jgi:hypothetical protein